MFLKNNKRDRDVPALLGVEALATFKGEEKKQKNTVKPLITFFSLYLMFDYI